jgi:hypothetical protein
MRCCLKRTRSRSVPPVPIAAAPIPPAPASPTHDSATLGLCLLLDAGLTTEQANLVDHAAKLVKRDREVTKGI